MYKQRVWKKIYKKCLQGDWIGKPTIFAKTAIEFFPQNGNLIDLGAGAGQDSRYFRSKGFEVTGVDFSETATKIAKELAEKQNLRYKILRLDLSKKLPFKEESFDVVYSHLALHYWDNAGTKRLFSEIYRILKTGRIFATLVNTMDDPETKIFKKIDDYLYLDPKDIVKRYFTIEHLETFISDKYEPIIFDDKGETYKDKIKCLIRFVGRKIKD